MKNKYILFFFFFVIMVMTWPVFGAWVPLFKRNWLLLGVSAITVSISVHEYFRSKQFYFLLIYAIIIEIYLLSGNTYYKGHTDVLIIISIFAVTGALSLYYIRSPYVDSKLRFLKLFLLFFLTVSISSFIINMFFPFVIRENVNYIVSGATSPYAFLDRYGLSNYDIPHAAPVLIPCFVYQLKDRNNKRFVYAVLIFACMVLAYVSGSTTALILVILVTILSFIIKKGSVRRNAGILIIWSVLTMMFMNDMVLLSLVRMMDDAFGYSTSLHERLMEIEASIVYGTTEGDLDSRVNLYMKSIDAFSKNILFGGEEIGGHSVIIDHLGTYGLLGFIPFALFLYYQIKSVMKYIPTNVRIYYYVSVFAGLAMLAFKNMSNWSMWCFLFLISPLILIGERNNSKYNK